jgi:hypothetical protein
MTAVAAASRTPSPRHRAPMAPMDSAEHGVQHVEHGVHDVEHGVHRVERFFGFRRHKTVAYPETKQLEPDAEDEQPDAPA